MVCLRYYGNVISVYIYIYKRAMTGVVNVSDSGGNSDAGLLRR